MNFKEFLQEESGDKEAYQKFLKKLLKKFNVKSVGELDDAKTKEYYKAVEDGWESDEELEKKQK